MKKIFCGIIAVIIVAAFLDRASAQEQILPLSFNPVITQSKSVQPSSLRTALGLPFVDDFSYQTIYPDPNNWVDRQAFVNSTFPINPPSFGVATLDGLKENGQPYDSLSHTFSSVGGADTLTSQPILLGSNSPADSVYFSFFYQPGGLGDQPNSAAFNLANFSVGYGDSLVLEFKDNTDSFQHIWAHDGTNATGPFQQVIIGLKNPIFFHDDFQFRFRNYATLIGQYDCWNIDYVKLNSNRSYNDTTITDVAIQYLPTSILKNYQSMPWNQFQDYQATEKADQQSISVKNNFNVVKNTSSSMSAFESVTGNSIFVGTPASQNLAAKSSTVIPFPSFPIQNFAGDSVVIATPFVVKATGDNNINNDSIVRYQVFSNYMAYDDGTPEAVYRLLGSPASLAMKYHLNTPDTLQAIEILFAHTDVNLTPNLFNLIVWKSIDPDSIMLEDNFLLPQFEDILNGFAFYRLSQPLPVTDSFYIGWQQVSLQSDLKMDVGFDFNDTTNEHLWFNVAGYWEQSQKQGTVMMRPVLGKTIPFGVGISPVNANNDFKIFPNPASDLIYVSGESNDLQLEVIDYSGRKILSANHQSSIDIRQLAEGMYLLRITDLRSGKTSIQKFVKAN